MGHPSPLSGRRIVITRSPDRAAALAALLIDQGAEPLVLPLIDFERITDTSLLDEVLDALTAGSYDWLVMSSATTVRALEERASAREVPLEKLVPADTRVAAVGSETAAALERAGLHVDLSPHGNQSAAGLVALWEGQGQSVLLPQADIAEAGLKDGLVSKGSRVTTVAAYRTVDYPASPELRLATSPGGSSAARQIAVPQITMDEARRLLSTGGLDAVIAASPSAARRIAESLTPLGQCAFVAIGSSTAAAARELRITVTATAAKPTPDGIVAALSELFAIERDLT